MRITQQQLRSLIRESLKESDRYRSQYDKVFGKELKSLDRGKGISRETTGADLARIIGGRESPTGTKRASLSGPKIQKWIAIGGRRRPSIEGIWGMIDDKNGIVPFKGVDWAVGLLFSEGARYVGSQSGIDYAAGFEYLVKDPTGLKASPYSGYVYYIRPNEFIQIDNVSITQRAEVFNKFRNATPEEKEYYISVFRGDATDQPVSSRVQASSSPAEELTAVPDIAASAAAAPVASASERFSAAKTRVRNLVRTPKEYAFWAGLVGKASKGKAGSDATFVRQVLGKNYETEWQPLEMAQFAQELMAMSKMPTK